jgi:methylated-DNA-protein-cysteine methyltransferase-like protein
MTGDDNVSPSCRAIYTVVSRIPRGKVATYGQVAALAGLPGRARQVGYALSALTGRSGIPWHRVVNAQGRVSLRGGLGEGEMEQRLRLEHEGVDFDAAGRIQLERFLWRPGEETGATPFCLPANRFDRQKQP